MVVLIWDWKEEPEPPVPVPEPPLPAEPAPPVPPDPALPADPEIIDHAVVMDKDLVEHVLGAARSHPTIIISIDFTLPTRPFYSLAPVIQCSGYALSLSSNSWTNDACFEFVHRPPLVPHWFPHWFPIGSPLVPHWFPTGSPLARTQSTYSNEPSATPIRFSLFASDAKPKAKLKAMLKTKRKATIRQC